MSGDAHRVPLDRVLDLVRGLGIEADPNTLRSVHISPGRIDVVRYRLDDAGQKYAVGSGDDIQAATEMVTIGIDP